MKVLAKSVKNAQKVFLITLCFLFCLVLSSCSSNEQHKIMVDPCEECRNVETYEVEVPAGSVTSSGTIILRSNEPVYLCTPAFTNKNGSSYIPYATSRFNMKQNEVAVTLNPGVYAFCIDRGKTSIGKVVVIREDSTNTPEIEFE